MLKDYLFTIDGEYVFVETYSVDHAFEILTEAGFDLISDEVVYTGSICTPEEVEVFGYDIY